MEQRLSVSLIYNITILLTMALIYSTFQNKVKMNNQFKNLFFGVLIGSAGLLIMSTSVHLDNDVIFDARSILVSVSGLFFGMTPNLIAGVMMIAYRMILGGPGIYVGILTILTTLTIGMVWRYYRFKGILEHRDAYVFEFYIFGLIVHIDMLLCMLFLPKAEVPITLGRIFWPVILLFPLGTYVLCMVFLNLYERNELITKLSASEEKYRKIAENTSDMIWTADKAFNLTYVSPSVEKLFGEDSLAYMKRTMEEKFPPEDLSRIKAIYKEEIIKNRNMASERSNSRIIGARHYSADGSLVWVSMHVSFIRDAQGDIIGLTGVTRDITALKKAEAKKREQIAFIVSLIDFIPDLIFYKDMSGVYVGCNKAFLEFAGRPQSEIIGKTDFDLFNAELAELFRRNDLEILKQKVPINNEEWVVYPDGRYILLDTLKTPYYDLAGNLNGILGISRDITERKQKEEEIYNLAFHDYLTGLYNRRFYEEELLRLDVKRNLPLTIAMGDVNGLKLVNDSFGHKLGDELLRKVAAVMKDSCRADDIIARFGGDEFVILLPKTDAAGTEKIISRINLLLSAEKINGVEISISFGHETKVHELQNIEDVLKSAENHLYQNKLFESASMRSKTINMIMNTLYEKNNREMLHSKRVSKICEEIALHLKLSKISVEKIKLAGLVHDIGKIGIDEKILNSPLKLSGDEWNEMKKHSEIGYRILSSANEFSEIADYVLQHQEKWDGSGYPKGLKAQEISIEARIIAVADAFDAMTGERTYGRVYSTQEAIEEIQNCAGTAFDPHIVNAFNGIMLGKAVTYC
ncbi:MAG TPA: hypothetical protein DIT32_01350 [Peptococcaceae bacterium]|nr:hypothetical protein [Peptococcaceae bacterium]